MQTSQSQNMRIVYGAFKPSLSQRIEIGVEARRRICEENFFGKCWLFSLLTPSKAGGLSILSSPQVQEEELSVRGWCIVPTVGGAQ